MVCTTSARCISGIMTYETHLLLPPGVADRIFQHHHLYRGWLLNTFTAEVSRIQDLTHDVRVG